MSDPPLEETTAWRLVLAALAPAAGEAHARRVRLPVPDGTDPERPTPGPSTDVWLDLEPSGSWRASAPPTLAARALLELYLPLALRPDLVIAQLGQSLDGRIATESGHSHYVTGPDDLTRLHRVRALVDAVVVGADTVALDDPRLTVRRVEGPNPVRVVLDPGGRLETGRRVFTDPSAHTLVLRMADPGTSPSAPFNPSGEDEPLPRPGSEGGAPPRSRPEGRAPPRPGHEGGAPPRSGPEVVFLPPSASGGLDPADVLVALRSRGLRRVLVEGGGVTVSRFLQAGLLDRLHLTVAPLLIGSGRPGITLPPIATMGEALRPRSRTVRLGEDVLFDLDLR